MGLQRPVPGTDDPRHPRGRADRPPPGQPAAGQHPTLGHEAATSTHLHGAPSRPQYDGDADDLTRPGQYEDHLDDTIEEERTIWYHDHAVHRTTEDVHTGLAGMGDVILVNGVPWPVTPVERRRHRFRIPVASPGRGYRLQLSPQVPTTVARCRRPTA